MTSKSSIHLLIFYMQSKEMFKLTPQLCRLAEREYEELRTNLPTDVRSDASFDKVLKLIRHVENSEFAKANELLGDAYKEHEEMMSYFPKKATAPKQDQSKEAPSILEDGWEPPVRPDNIPTPPAVKHTVNEDDTRNWNNKSPIVSREYEKLNVTNNGTGDEDFNSHRQTYLTTMRHQRDGKPDYETVFVSNSPAVLADKFTDLYKNEWKAAHEELEVVLGDKQSVRHMLWIIAKSSIICASLATQQLTDIENSVVGVMLSRDPLNKHSLVDEPLAQQNEKSVAKARTLLIDYRRELSKLSVPMLQREIKRAVASELGTTLPRRFTGIGHNFINYAEKCIELIWLMYVHDPPMHLEWLTREQEGTSFRSDLYTPFTRPGTLYDYCVWPVVRLHRNGPVLCKGVAQGR